MSPVELSASVGEVLPLLGAVFVASLLGSAHCAGMCGAFVAFSVVEPPKPTPRWRLHMAYNLGRLTTYAVLGAIAGGVGAAVDLGGSMIGVQRAAAVLAGSMMVVFGVIAVLRHLGVHIPRRALPSGLVRLATAAHRRALNLSPITRALVVGLLTTLLPCGWLYAFVITSSATAHPALGALSMAAFWGGTLPVMVSLGAGLSVLAGPLKRHVPLATSVLLVVIGLATVVGRVAMPAIDTAALARPATLSEAARNLDNAEEVCPLCRHGGKTHPDSSN